MSTTPNLEKLLQDSGLADKAQHVDTNLVRMQWGSAFVLVGVSGSAVVAIAPLFRELPRDRVTEFYRKLLDHNAYMGGMAAFAIQPDGWVILHAGRALRGMDANEFATMVAGVGRFADQFDDQLIGEFYAAQPEATNQAPVQ
ncbi:MAG TPA: YbjN domain-containing protein [Kofleriaceae bacterium]|nr:YbjN domain-containing protein [Kofleriaceae bacterium]